MKSKKKIILSVVLSIICILIISIGIYLGTYSHSDPMVEEYLVSDDTVKVEEIDNYYYFDGPGERDAIIFYPGAKVETKSYAPILHQLAENGVDCFLVKMPCNMAILDSDAAKDIIGKYTYKEWYMSGHSMGGAAAAIYTADNSEELDGLILLAAYPTKEISNDIDVLFIYGSEDGVLKMDKYNEGKNYVSDNSKEVVISGGNHAQFGNYGKQRKDNDAEISTEEQQSQTINNILEFVNR